MQVERNRRPRALNLIPESYSKLGTEAIQTPFKGCQNLDNEDINRAQRGLENRELCQKELQGFCMAQMVMREPH